MGLSYSQAKSLGLEHLFPSARSDADILRERFGIESAGGAPGGWRVGKPTKLEQSFADRLEVAKVFGLLDRWKYEPIRLKLAGRCTYRPDFGVSLIPLAPFQYMIEVKGPYAREDSVVKLKVAAVMYPEYTWLFCRRQSRHEWDVRTVTDRGIGSKPIHVLWIHGV